MNNQGEDSEHCVPFSSMSVAAALPSLRTLSPLHLEAVLSLCSLFSLAFVSLNFFCPGDSTMQAEDNKTQIDRKVLVKAVVRQLGGQET
jgi:hypothetical protein